MKKIFPRKRILIFRRGKKNEVNTAKFCETLKGFGDLYFFFCFFSCVALRFDSGEYKENRFSFLKGFEDILSIFFSSTFLKHSLRFSGFRA